MTESPSPAPAPPAPADPDLRQLRRSRNDKVVGGVCGGLGRYLGVDPVLLRVAAAALALSGGVGVLAYVVAWVAIPEAAPDEPETAAPRADRHAVALAVGAALVALGALLLLRSVVPWFGADLFWPLVVVGAGVLVVISARR
jgi:phage shock protein C